ncbi:Protein O-glucosyltransferase [Dirofilaria immitis]
MALCGMRSLKGKQNEVPSPRSLFKRICKAELNAWEARKEGLHYFHFTDSTLIEQIKHARTQNHNKTLNAIRQFVLQHLQPLNIYCYYADFVQKYTNKLEKIPMQPEDKMELIPKIPPEKR